MKKNTNIVILKLTWHYTLKTVSVNMSWIDFGLIVARITVLSAVLTLQSINLSFQIFLVVYARKGQSLKISRKINHRFTEQMYSHTLNRFDLLPDLCNYKVFWELKTGYNVGWLCTRTNKLCITIPPSYRNITLCIILLYLFLFPWARSASHKDIFPLCSLPASIKNAAKMKNGN